MSEMSKEAKAMKAAYAREYRRKHPEKDKEYHKRYWEKKARAAKAETAICNPLTDDQESRSAMLAEARAAAGVKDAEIREKDLDEDPIIEKADYNPFLGDDETKAAILARARRKAGLIR